jgi:hypothetical protein
MHSTTTRNVIAIFVTQLRFLKNQRIRQRTMHLEIPRKKCKPANSVVHVSSPRAGLYVVPTNVSVTRYALGSRDVDAQTAKRALLLITRATRVVAPAI